MERLDDVLKISVDFQVIFFNIVDEANHRMMMVEAAIELACLCNKNAWSTALRAGRNGVRASSTAATNLRAGCADNQTWIKSALNENVREH